MENIMNDDTPFYTDEEVKKGIEEFKSKISRNSKFIINAIIERGFWKFFWLYLDKELLTYRQKKMVANEIFPIIKKMREEIYKNQKRRYNEK